MRERVAVLSDIHGVLPALEAVLAEPDVASADLIVLTGDIADGPQPVEVLDRLAALGDRACWVGGNGERDLVAAHAGRPAPYDVSNWAAAQLRDDQVARLAALPQRVTLPVAGLGEVLFCHATPRDDEEMVLVDSRLDRWAEVFAGLPAEATTVVCGHTHMPFARLVDRRLVVNPGSVGMPYGGAGAWWALLGPGVQLRRTPFDVDAACARIAAGSTFPDAAAWADEYVRSRHSDADALAVFGPRDGR
ncbi:YfcE family phosphodiesterase [Micromonospora sp. WMMA2032]|uniref:metallophosphoesterase family protein n=1 Tax=unclassified Micromonospora TaxID=2617518 RepID=UPI000C058282|nr:metallophosphoesterase family protein [Micromonospora sp. WMMA2032]ATO16021.1 YfcE family phosphodiesterase [Micromonospora sp. WMMA2032]